MFRNAVRAWGETFELVAAASSKSLPICEYRVLTRVAVAVLRPVLFVAATGARGPDVPSRDQTNGRMCSNAAWFVLRINSLGIRPKNSIARLIFLSRFSKNNQCQLQI